MRCYYLKKRSIKTYTPDYDGYFFYYSETLDSLLVIMNMSSGGSVLERVETWNNNGLPTSIKDTKYGLCTTFGAMRTYNLNFSYSKDAATVTLTILPGLGTWADGSESKTVTVNIGSYLGNAMSGIATPTCTGLAYRSEYLAKQDGSLINYGDILLDDMTLTYIFYDNSGAPNILTFVDPGTLILDVTGYTSSTPILVYPTDGSRDGFYFTSGAKQTLTYTFKDVKAPASTKSLYVYGANVSLGDEEGPFTKSNCSLSSLTLNQNATIADYAFAHTCVETVSFQGSVLGSIGNYAFANCQYLQTFYCGRINNIGSHAFYRSGLSGLFTSAYASESIGEAAFDECEDLYGVLVSFTVLDYRESYQWNRFVKNNQVAPEGWDANWNGDAHIVYELTEDDFSHESSEIPVTGVVGGSSGAETISFAISFPYSETETYGLYVAAYADNKITIMDAELTVIYETTDSEYQKTVEGLPGGQLMYVPANDVLISPIYKYIVDEITAENVTIPVSGEPLIERAIEAPEGADYYIDEYSNACYKVEGSVRTSVYTYDADNPYIFKNDTAYEFEFQFRIPNNTDYLLHPDGYKRDSGCQINIDGLDDSDYQIIEAKFTNMSKDSYKVTIAMNSINRYAVSVTDGDAFVNNKKVELAAEGANVLLIADTAPVGQAFDKWEITGLTLSEEELASSRLLIEMPGHEVTAVATYKSVPYYTVSFDANGGTGTISDDISYGTYTLPECTLTAPEHMHFVAWSVNDVEYDEYETIIVDTNIVIKAIWAYDEHTISFACTGGASGTMDPVVKKYNDTYTIPSPTFTPDEGKEFKYWEISGEKVTTTTITITGDVTLTAVYGVVPVAKTLESITLSGTQQTEFEVGDTFSYEGLVVTAHYSDTTEAVVTGYTVSGYDMATAGTQTVTVSYTEDGITKTANYSITVKAKELPPVDPDEPETPDTPDNPSNEKKGLPIGAIIGIAAGSAVAVAVVVVIIVVVVKKRK